MPLSREIEYWQGRAQECVDGGVLKKDNVWKRPHQLRRLLQYNWLNETVLEIGTGNGVVAGVLRAIVQHSWMYCGTELAPAFREHAMKAFGLDTIEADVREIPGCPDPGFTRIIAFDSLEHVRPEHRQEGYKRMAEVAAPDALLFIHYSHSPSAHDKEFDHPFGLEDLVDLESAGFALVSLERYNCDHPSGVLDYVFVVMQRRA